MFCLYLWIVHSWCSLSFSLTFIQKRRIIYWSIEFNKMLGGRFEVNSFLHVWVCVLLAVCTLTAGMLSLFLIKRHVFLSGILFIFCFIEPILISGIKYDYTYYLIICLASLSC
jgi:hypothetical protein